jgi:LysM repeat protein
MALADRTSLRPFDFRADVHNGRVRLRGDVTTREQRRQAERTARAVDGVDTLVNEVTVQGRRPALAKSTDSPPDDPSAVYYTVEAGDTLWNIAQDHRASISRLKDLNNLSTGSLQPGQRIRIR